MTDPHDRIDLERIWQSFVNRLGISAERPSYTFDPQYYSRQYPEAARAGGAYAHFDRVGRAQGHFPNLASELTASLGPLNDRLDAILKNNQFKTLLRTKHPNVAELVLEVLALGDPTDRSLSHFSSAFYLSKYPHLATSKLSPLEHFIRFGQAEGRKSLTALTARSSIGGQRFNQNLPVLALCVADLADPDQRAIATEYLKDLSDAANIVLLTLKGEARFFSLKEYFCFAQALENPSQELDFIDYDQFRRTSSAILIGADCHPFAEYMVARDLPFISYISEHADMIVPQGKAILLGLFSEGLVFSSDSVAVSWAPILSDIRFNSTSDSLILPFFDIIADTAEPEVILAARQILSQQLETDLTDRKIIAGFGDMNWRSGFDLFVTTAQCLSAQDPTCVCIWFGSGNGLDDLNKGVWEHRHLELAKQHKTLSSFFVLADCNNEQTLMRATDIVLGVTRMETATHQLSRALQFGCKAIMFEDTLPLTGQAVQENLGGDVVPFGRVDLLVEKIRAAPNKLEFQSGRFREVLQSRRIGYDTLSHLQKCLRPPKTLSLYSGQFDLPIFPASADKSQSVRQNEQSKVVRLGRLAVWPSSAVAANTLRQSGHKVHASIEVRGYEGLSEREALIHARPFAIHNHVYYLDQFEADLIGHILAYRSAKECVFTTDDREKAQKITEITQRLGLSATVLEVENRGRDIVPFLHLFQRDGIGLEHGHWVHVHQKKAAETALDGEAWRTFLMASVLGNANSLSQASAMIADGEIGLIAPFDPYIFGWGPAHRLARDNAHVAKLDLPPHPLLFPCGSMFWVHTRVARAMLGLFGTNYAWPAEPIATDGTVYHLIERLWPSMAHHVGLKTVFLDNTAVPRWRPKSAARAIT